MGYVEDLRGKKQGQGRPRWRARYRDPSGRERSKSFARKIDAERFLVSVEDAKLRGDYVDPAAGRLPFAEWAECWFNTTAALRPTTRRDYRKVLDQQILPAFERASLAGIDTLAIREWLAGLIGGGLGPKRAGKALAVLSQVLDAAQVEDFAEAIGPRWATLIRFGAYSGLRPSELTALRVARLDLLRGTVRVVEAATEVDGHLHWGPVETHEARTVRIPRSICEELGTQLAGRPHGRDDLAFPAPLGGPMRWGKWTRRYFKPAAVRAGLFVTREVDPKTGQVVVSSALRLYDLRHTCASLLIAQGASVKAVQAQLGHATASITLDTYGHLFPSELEALADRLEQV